MSRLIIKKSRIFLFWWTILNLINIPTITASQSPKFLLNNKNQIAIGQKTGNCVTIRSNFRGPNNLAGQSKVKPQKCTKSASVSQSFEQIFFDPNNYPDVFAICLSKYFNGPDGEVNWTPKFWCLIGRYRFVKVLKAKSIEELRNDLKWQWSYNEENQLINSNMGGRIMNVKRANRIILSPIHTSVINNFGTPVDLCATQCTTCKNDIDYCAINYCENNSTCISGPSSFTCLCQPGWKGIVCHKAVIDYCNNNQCQHNSICQGQ